jgi:RNA polymerase sigma factor (sigma-70 family)
MTDIPDETLMLAWQTGDKAAFNVLYQRYRPTLFSYLMRHTGNRAQAEEVYQETWLTLVRQRQAYSVTAAFRSYLFCLAHSRLHDHYRKQGRRWEHEQDMDEEIAGQLASCEREEPDAQLSREQQWHRLLFCLQQLPPEQRSVMLLRLEAELSLQAMADQLQVAFETLKSRFRYAQRKLQQCLTPGEDA